MNCRKKIAIVAILLLAILCSLTGCTSRKTEPPAASLKIEMGCDFTAKKEAEESARQAASVLAGIEPSDSFVLRAVDHKTTIITNLHPEDEAAAYALMKSLQV